MNTIKVNQIKAENFKCFKSEVFDFEDNMSITAQNGTGKTTIYDVLLWVLFDKDSQGKSEFGVRPVDKNNKALKGLVTVGEIHLDINGVVDIFRRELHERIVKKQICGYTSKYSINGAPRTEADFKTQIALIIPQPVFKMLTDLTYFNGKIHWEERRLILLALAGEIGTPKGFDDLLKSLSRITLKEQKNVLSCQRLAYQKEQDGINPRIDEVQRSLDEYTVEDTGDIEKARIGLQGEVVEFDAKREKILKSETKRQKLLTSVNNLEAKRITRESVLKNDTSAVKGLINRKTTVEAGLRLMHGEMEGLRFYLDDNQVKIDAATIMLSRKTVLLDDIRKQFKIAQSSEDICPICTTHADNWPEAKKAEITDRRSSLLKELSIQGTNAAKEIKEAKTNIADLSSIVAKYRRDIMDKEAKLKKATAEKDELFVGLEEKINANVTPKPEDDSECLALDEEIKAIKAKIGEPIADQLEGIEKLRSESQEDITKLDNALKNSDQHKKNQTRIAELDAREKELGQLIADIEKQIEEIGRYESEESKLIQTSVNSKFKHVKFKMFDHILNGDIKLCCTALYEGRAYGDMSAGEKILVGIDVVNVLSKHYGFSVPLFIDHAESFTSKVESESQTIRLVADVGVKTLVFEKE